MCVKARGKWIAHFSNQSKYGIPDRYIKKEMPFTFKHKIDQSLMAKYA